MHITDNGTFTGTVIRKGNKIMTTNARLNRKEAIQ